MRVTFEKIENMMRFTVHTLQRHAGAKNFAHMLQGLDDSQLDGAAAPTAADGAAGNQNGGAQSGGAKPQLDARQPGFVPLDETSVVDFVAAKPHLAERLGGAASKSKWKVRCSRGADGLC